MRKYKIDAMESIYKTMGIKDLRVNQYRKESGLVGILPDLGAIGLGGNGKMGEEKVE